MKPLAPGRLSMTTDWPRSFAIFSPSSRNTLSGPLPVENGVMMRSDLLGYGCPTAGPLRAAQLSKKAPKRCKKRMADSPGLTTPVSKTLFAEKPQLLLRHPIREREHDHFFAGAQCVGHPTGNDKNVVRLQVEHVAAGFDPAAAFENQEHRAVARPIGARNEAGRKQPHHGCHR